MSDVQVINITAYNLYDFVLAVGEKVKEGFVIADTVAGAPRRLGAVFTLAMVKGANVKTRESHNAVIKDTHLEAYGIEIIAPVAEEIQVEAPVISNQEEVKTETLETTPESQSSSESNEQTETNSETSTTTEETTIEGSQEKAPETTAQEQEGQGKKLQRQGQKKQK